MGSIGLSCMSVAGAGAGGGGLPVVVSQAASSSSMMMGGGHGLTSGGLSGGGGLDGGMGLLGEYDEFMQFSFQSASLDILDRYGGTTPHHTTPCMTHDEVIAAEALDKTSTYPPTYLYPAKMMPHLFTLSLFTLTSLPSLLDGLQWYGRGVGRGLLRERHRRRGQLGARPPPPLHGNGPAVLVVVVGWRWRCAAHRHGQSHLRTGVFVCPCIRASSLTLLPFLCI